MVDPSGAGKVVAKVAEQAVEQGGKGPHGMEAGGDAQARFQQAMGQGGEDRDATSRGNQQGQGEVAPVESAEARPEGMQVQAAAEGPRSPGDHILHGISKMRHDFHAVQDEIKAIDPSKLGPGDMLQVQLHMSRVVMNEQLVGQVGGAVEKDIDTLLKS